MPISIAALKLAKRTITIAFTEKESLSLTYDPNAVNADREAQEAAQRSQGLSIAALAGSLHGIILEWDLVDEHGKPLPPSLETLKGLGLPVLMRLNREINRDFFPLMRSDES